MGQCDRTQERAHARAQEARTEAGGASFVYLVNCHRNLDSDILIANETHERLHLPLRLARGKQRRVQQPKKRKRSGTGP